MKKLLLLLCVCLLFVSSLQSQEHIKPDLNYLRKVLEKENTGNEELQKSKLMVDAAINDSRFTGNPEFWFYRGRVYEKIFESSNNITGVSKSEAIKNMANAYSFVNDESNIYASMSARNLERFWGNMLNRGLEGYQSGNLNEAIRYFQYCSLVNPNDTTGFLYAASAANELGDFLIVSSNYEQLVQIQPTVINYVSLVSTYFYSLNDTNAALRTLEQAKIRIGDQHPELLIIETDINIKNNNYNKAITLLDNTISLQPNNPQLYLKKALVLDQMISNLDFDQEKKLYYVQKVEFAYNKTIELDPSNFTAYYNLAVSKGTRAFELLENAKNMSGTERENTKHLAYSELKYAAQLMEKAHELNPDDVEALFALSLFYERLENKIKLEVINSKIKQLGF